MFCKACSFLVIACIAAATSALLLRSRTADAHIPITTNIVFKREVVRIFQRKCFHCHTAGNLAMPLTSYRDARPWARAIREEVLERRMPPWHAVGGHGRFANDIGLTAREIDLLVAWIDGGAPSGVPKADEATASATVPVSREWETGEPDVMRAIGASRAIEPGAAHETARFVVSTGLERARWLRGIAFAPGDRRVVRAAAFYRAETREWLGAWTPWHGTAIPEGGVYRLPAGARLLIEVHYKGCDECDESVTDRSRVGLYLTDDPPARPASSLIDGRESLQVPAGTSRHRVRTRTMVTAPAVAFAVWPELGPGGRSIEVTASTPDGVVLPLLWVNDYRPEWPTPYIFQAPVALPRGTTIATTAYFDNHAERSLATQFRVTLAIARTRR